MVSTNDDSPEFPDEISTSSEIAKLCFSLQPCRISSVQFPEELLYEIFLRLPVKSLIWFRCLSKGMRRLIDSPIFIKNHNIHRSVISERDRPHWDSDDEEYAIFLHQPRFHRLFSLKFDKDDNNLNRAKAIELNCTFVKEAMKAGMIPMDWCCNGIFCFKNSYSDPRRSFVFWNPSNGTFRKVDCSFCVTNSSMCYDYVNDDYKIIGFIDRPNEISMAVYSFRKDSWRKFHRDIPLGKYCFTRAVCLSGVIHWLWVDRTNTSIFIAAFDLVTETFTSLPVPLEARQLDLQPSHFTEFRGRLCISFLPGFNDPQTIWVMEKYGIESSWTRLYNFDPASHIHNFYFPNSKRQLLSHYRWLSWWDPQDGSFKKIEISGLLNDQAFLPYDAYVFVTYVFLRNLVRLDQCLV